MERLRHGLVSAWSRQAPWLWLLRPIECLYRLVTALRRSLYRNGLLKIYHPSRPVVVVGNITAGGSGKTPVVIALVETLQQRGLRVGVVSRGYGADAGVFPLVVEEHTEPEQCGDEPLLIHRRTSVPCVVAPSRVAATRTLLERFQVDLVISDDGLQHYALGRDMEIAMLDAVENLGNGFCLPAGPLREPASRLRTVDLILTRGGDGPAAVNYRADALVNLQGDRQLAADNSVLGERVYAVAAIGMPEQFCRSLEEIGFRPRLVSFPDHHRFEPDDLADLTDLPVIMTEKDAVKCASFAGPDTWYLRISAQLPASVIDAVATLPEHVVQKESA